MVISNVFIVGVATKLLSLRNTKIIKDIVFKFLMYKSDEYTNIGHLRIYNLNVYHKFLSFFLIIVETAMLLPGKYASKMVHSSSQKYDVRSNLKSYRQREGKQ